MNKTSNIVLALILGLLLLLGSLYLGYFVSREEFWTLFGVFSLLFVGAGFFIRLHGKSWQWIFFLGLLIRLGMLLTFPKLSDDYARFLWDGELVRIEQNPYSETPREWLESNQDLTSPYLDNLFEMMNSRDYYSVYPPSNQLIFWLGSLGAKMDPWQGIVCLRMMILIGEIGLYFIILSLIKKVNIAPSRLGWYWLNPLVIFELTVNLHFEGLVLLTLIATLLFLHKKKILFSGLMVGLSVGLKLLPLILLPALFFFVKKKQLIPFVLGLFGMLFICFAPLLYGDSLENFLQSVRLYQGKFEFNASVYYLLREVGFWIQGYNTIATLTKILSGLTMVLILWLSWSRRGRGFKELIHTWMLVYLIYLVLQPVVHPWYIIPALGLSLFTQSKIFLAWSWLIIWSYLAYSNPEFTENPWILTLEYFPLFILIVSEYFRPRKDENLTQNLSL